MKVKIGVISDTHLSEPDEALWNLSENLFADVEMVLHAGDLTRLSILDVFADREVVAVCGNMDSYEVSEKLLTREIIKVNGCRIGLIHGWGSPWGIENRIIDDFQEVDAIVYGHTHKAANDIKNGVLMFNPGAFSGSFLLKRNRSAGLLTVDNGRISGTIVNL